MAHLFVQRKAKTRFPGASGRVRGGFIPVLENHMKSSGMNVCGAQCGSRSSYQNGDKNG
jgi:hypothetical protein